MSNQPSGWTAPPYYTRFFLSGGGMAQEANPAVATPIPTGNSFSIRKRLPTDGNETRLFVKFSAPVTMKTILGLFLDSSPLANTGIEARWEAGVTPAPGISELTQVTIEGITVNFDPATVTWNNQGALTYQNLYTLQPSAGGMLTVGLGPLPAAIIITGEARVPAFLAPSTYPHTLASPIYGIRFMLLPTGDALATYLLSTFFSPTLAGICPVGKEP